MLPRTTARVEASVKGGARVRRAVWRSKTAALPERFCENPWSFETMEVVNDRGCLSRKERKCIAAWNNGWRFDRESFARGSANGGSCGRRGCIGRRWRRFRSILARRGISVRSVRASRRSIRIGSGFVRSWNRISTSTRSRVTRPSESGNVCSRRDSREAARSSRMRFANPSERVRRCSCP